MEELGMIKVEMEEGMWFEFSGKEDEEEQVVEEFDAKFLISVSFVYFDIRTYNHNHNHNEHHVIEARRHVVRRPDAACCLQCYFKVHLGHGLSPQEMENCMTQFKAVMDRLIYKARPSPRPQDGNYRRRRFTFNVKRVGVAGTRYHAREIEMREEEGVCRRRMEEMLEAGLCPADPDKVDRLLGNANFRSVQQKEGDECSNRIKIYECSICLEGFAAGEYVTYLVCQHVFHTVCIAKWFYQKNTCPVCRHPIPPMYAHVEPNPFI